MPGDSKIKNLIRLGFSCNVQCKFCNFIEEMEREYDDFSFSAIKKQIDNLAGIDYISFSGGEPLVRDDLLKIIEYASQKGIANIDIQTNAILLDEKKIINLKKAGLNIAFVSFHIHLPLLYEKLLNQKNIFDLVYRNINLLLKHNIKVILNPVINSLTYKYLPGFASYIINNFPNIESISLSVIQPHGRALQYKKLLPNYLFISPYIKKFVSYIKDNSQIRVINPYCGLPMCIADWYLDLAKNVEYIENKENYKADKNKIYLSICKQCKYKNLCNGVWREYVDIFGEKEILKWLKPVNE
jgi:MoaA/NifB/PqqE/SkfB family radical SAM enzyme